MELAQYVMFTHWLLLYMRSYETLKGEYPQKFMSFQLRYWDTDKIWISLIVLYGQKQNNFFVFHRQDSEEMMAERFFFVCFF